MLDVRQQPVTDKQEGNEPLGMREHIGKLADSLFERTMAELQSVPAPLSTYRLQLTPDFNFDKAAEIVGYLEKLGVTTVYLSPILQANPGSSHGYDVVDHSQIDSSRGGMEAFVRLSDRLKESGITTLLDIVPNHMGTGPHNGWWESVLENGQASPHERCFDVNWQPIKKELHGKVLLPVLGAQYGEVLENAELKIKYDGQTFKAAYYDHVFPVNVAQLPAIIKLTENRSRIDGALGNPTDVHELASIVRSAEALPELLRQGGARQEEGLQEQEVIKRRFAKLVEANPGMKNYLDERLTEINGRKGEPDSFEDLHSILEEQNYRLAYWRVADGQINYRRFFDINTLAAIKMENEQVFSDSHKLVFDLYREGRIDALRIDHPDGLSDPADYFTRLQERLFLARAEAISEKLTDKPSDIPFDALAAELKRRFRSAANSAASSEDLKAANVPVFAEKILGHHEAIPSDWMVAGTTGYKFLNTLNGIYVDQGKERKLDEIYEKFIGVQRASFPELLYETKKLILSTAMASQVNALTVQLADICEQTRRYRDFPVSLLKTAIVEYVAAFPLYRTYLGDYAVSEKDRYSVRATIEKAAERNPNINASVFTFLEDVLVNPGQKEPHRAARLEFATDLQQLTSPVMAKSMEDTAFYLYLRMCSLNEVGGEPQFLGTSIEDFHTENEERQKTHPIELNATSTHDTKRGEDVRARMNLISEYASEWEELVHDLKKIGERFEQKVGERSAPDANEEYLIYQTIIGSLPFDYFAGANREAYVNRVQAYMIKAVKEAKANTNWINPNAPWEEALTGYIKNVLGDEQFLERLRPFQEKIMSAGIVNSLSQTAVKLTAPGTPDIYQGCEDFNFSLVDPDNRRPVDFVRLSSQLEEMREAFGNGPARDALLSDLMSNQEDGRSKQLLTWRALSYREQNPDLFVRGGYEALNPAGEHAERVVAFARQSATDCCVTIAPRCAAAIHDGRVAWDDTRIYLPEGGAEDKWVSVVTDREMRTYQDASGRYVIASEVFADYPANILKRV